MINYDGKRFRAISTAPGEEGAVALYRQEGDLVWGEFTGGNVRHGSLTGICGQDGSLEFTYCMVIDGDAAVSGRCVSTPELLDDGRVRLHETWERYGPHAANGVSKLEEA